MQWPCLRPPVTSRTPGVLSPARFQAPRADPRIGNPSGIYSVPMAEDVFVFAAWRETVIAAPLAFLAGLVIGVWTGGRFIVIRKRGDEG
jgi:hypothetical protein